ncbi:MAG: hypothetical protein WBI63_06930 [Coriobacteriia bacterium]
MISAVLAAILSIAVSVPAYANTLPYFARDAAQEAVLSEMALQPAAGYAHAFFGGITPRCSTSAVSDLWLIGESDVIGDSTRLVLAGLVHAE